MMATICLVFLILITICSVNMCLRHINSGEIIYGFMYGGVSVWAAYWLADTII
ncbi:hypothetical protein [Salmonella phage vB_SenAc-pSK20]|uniref:Uncharacterized protein n=2 Tax=Kuttervirus TaxID=2169536 RepID=A0A6G9L972_9CAUD|nr:hypothetical protein BI169_gp077 [Salmonella phage GG32]QIQ62145.1 hypothetical protein kage_77 [Salmonella phage kage]QKE54744.1 hypothetical protein AC4HA11_0910 [Escherichia phage vB_EcoA_4HA11]UCR92371.1 hypothetical protein LPEK22_00119 [Escherichia phage LPEK22]UGL60311.1 hypothetical protein [Salmonella phage vB_SenAc-pSC20]WRQ13311.1 hypothetical protein [Salmonella phage vB_SenAc-pSK20]